MTRIPELIDHYVKAWRGTYETVVLKTPSTVCDPEFSAEVVPFVEEIVGKGNVNPVPPMKGAELWLCNPGSAGVFRIYGRRIAGRLSAAQSEYGP